MSEHAARTDYPPDLRPSAIRWPQVFALLLLDLCLLLSWMAYNEFQPKLVTLYRLGVGASSWLVVQVCILVLAPPVAGYLTDRLLKRGGTRLAVVNVGIALAAMVFMATALNLSGAPTSAFAAWLPMLVVVWLIAMNIFHSPALSMLELYAPVELMPGVAALFTVLSGLTAAMEPGLVGLIDALGPPATFAAGGVVVAVVGYLFFRSAQGVEPLSVTPAVVERAHDQLLVVFLVGVALGLGEAAMSDGLPLWIAGHGDLAQGFAPSSQSSLLYALAALVAWPLGRLGNRYGAEALAGAGVLGGIAVVATAWMLPGVIARIAVWAFPGAYAAIAVAALPLAFSRLAPGRKVMGVGLLFSGIELVTGVVDIATLN